MPKFRSVAAGRRMQRLPIVRIVAARLLTVLAIIFWPGCWLTVAVLHAQQFGTGLASLSLEPFGTFAWHQALFAGGPWGSLILAAVAEELRWRR